MTFDKRPVLENLEVSDDVVRVWLRDGRTVTVPLSWYPRLCHGTPSERNKWQAIGNGTAVHWPELDEDISTGGLITGPSLERSVTLGRWILARQQGRGITGYEIDEHERLHRATPLA